MQEGREVQGKSVTRLKMTLIYYSPLYEKWQIASLTLPENDFNMEINLMFKAWNRLADRSRPGITSHNYR